MNYSFVSDYAGDLLIERRAIKNDMIVANLHLEVDNMVDWSAKPILTLNLSKYGTTFGSIDWTKAAWQQNNTIDGR